MSTYINVTISTYGCMCTQCSMGLINDNQATNGPLEDPVAHQQTTPQSSNQNKERAKKNTLSIRSTMKFVYTLYMECKNKSATVVGFHWRGACTVNGRTSPFIELWTISFKELIADG